MSVTPQNLLRLLADGEVHSGTALAGRLGVTRAAVWKVMQQLAATGVEVRAARGKGYHLDDPLELLDANVIRTGLSPAVAAQLDALEVHWALPSTSDHLLAGPRVAPGRMRVCLAEMQSGGRGRRGRTWFAVAGHGLCLSVAWRFASSPAQLSSLGLAAGVGVLRAVRRAGAAAALLKWPNDVVLDGRKLAGILVDVQGEAGGPMQVVVGVGLNYRAAATTTAGVAAAGGLPPASLCEAAGPQVAARNAVAALLVEALHGVLGEFGRDGFSALAAEWRAADYLGGRAVTVLADDMRYSGTVRGIAADGRLQLATDNGILHLLSGDVSVRPADG